MSADLSVVLATAKSSSSEKYDSIAQDFYLHAVEVKNRLDNALYYQNKVSFIFGIDDGSWPAKSGERSGDELTSTREHIPARFFSPKARREILERAQKCFEQDELGVFKGNFFFIENDVN